MEMRRLSHRGVFKCVSLTAFYKYLSGYGEKYWRAFFWLGIFLVLFAANYLLTGIEQQSGHAKVTKVIIYNLAFQPSTFLTGSFWNDYFSSLLHTFEVATFQRDRTFSPVSMSGRFLEIFQ